jgi:hypothetical protein
MHKLGTDTLCRVRPTEPGLNGAEFLPLAAILHDDLPAPASRKALDDIRVARVGPGRPRCRPEVVIADKAYSHP